ncbi:MAG: thiol:disulfide interchange protein DsbA/DsbL [Pseudomonadota bacterium]
MKKNQPAPSPSFLRALLFCLAALASMPLAGHAAAPASTAPRYDTLPAPYPALHGTVPVLAFFSYTCWHCHTFEPSLHRWSTTGRQGVAFKRIPISFGKDSIALQRLHFTLEELGVLPQLHMKIFTAVHDQPRRLFDDGAVLQFALSNGLDARQFRQAYHSAAVSAKVRDAEATRQRYQVNHLPALVVGGRYRLSPEQFVARHTGLDMVLAFFQFDNTDASRKLDAAHAMLAATDQLIEQLQTQAGKPAPTATPGSTLTSR